MNRRLAILLGLFAPLSNAWAADATYLCAYQSGDLAQILRVTVSGKEIQWVERGSAFFQATIIDNDDGRVTAVSVPRGGNFTADLFMLDVEASGRSGFVWSRASLSGQSNLLRGECGKAS